MAGDATDSLRTPDSSDDRWTVLYDVGCGFCRWTCAQVLALDRRHRLRPLAIQDPRAEALLHDLGPDERLRSWHLVSPSGERSSAGAALAPLLGLLPAGTVPAALLRRVPNATERAYAWVAGNRSRLSRLVPSQAKRRADEAILRRQ